jgi:hypothetical protein
MENETTTSMNKMTWEELVDAGQANRKVWVVWRDENGPRLEPFTNFSLDKYWFDHNEREWAFYPNYWFAYADCEKRK